LVCFFILYDKI